MASADIDATGEAVAAIGHIEDRAAEVRETQVARALARLKADGELTDEQRAVVQAMAERLTERIVANPRASLREADRRGDDTAATAIALFSRGSDR